MYDTFYYFPCLPIVHVYKNIKIVKKNIFLLFKMHINLNAWHMLFLASWFFFQLSMSCILKLFAIFFDIQILFYCQHNCCVISFILQSLFIFVVLSISHLIFRQYYKYFFPFPFFVSAVQQHPDHRADNNIYTLFMFIENRKS